MLSSAPQIGLNNGHQLVPNASRSYSVTSRDVGGPSAQLTQSSQSLPIGVPTATGPLSVNTFSVEPSTIGIMLVVSSLSLLLAAFWVKIYRLTSLVKRRDQRIKSLLTVDPVTALSNRDRFRQVGESRLRTMPSTAIALLSIRLDNFKSVRSELGDQSTDELLQLVSRRLQSCVAPLDTLARTGEDEFSLLVGARYNAEGGFAERQGLAVNIAKHLLSVTHSAFYVRAQRIKIKSSVGIALVSTTVETLTGATATFGKIKRSHTFSQKGTAKAHFERLLLQANIAGSQVRTVRAEKARTRKAQVRKGGDRYAIFHPEMEAARAVRAQQRQALKVALVRKEMRVRYQPIVDLKTSETVGFEALVRWQHPQLGLLRPYEFLPLAEKMGLTIEIDRWMLEIACQQLANWQYEHLYPSVSVNLSGEHLSRLDLVQTVETLLSRYAIEPSQLRVEVTESVMIADSEQAIATLNQLQKMGLRVSLDDFGTGYCSFRYLSQFPVDALKIDRSFVKGLGQGTTEGFAEKFTEEATEKFTGEVAKEADERASRETEQPVPSQTAPSQTNEAIVRSILALAKDLGIAVIAEGIEHLEQCQWLQQMDCQYGQGNFFAAALTEFSAQALLTARPITTKTKDEDARSHHRLPPRLSPQSQR